MNRIDKLRGALPKGFGAALVQNEYNRGYLTRFLSSAGFLLITERDAWLLADFRYVEAAGEQAVGAEVVLMESAYDQIAQLLHQAGAARVCVERTMTIGTLEKLREKLADAEIVTDDTLSEAVQRLRAVKEPGEINAIRRAQAVTDAAFSYILGVIRPGMTERQVAAELEYHMRKNGADALSFPTICVAGVKSSLPHGVPGDNVIREGDFLTMDFGALKDGYCSDMTRTVAIGGVSDEQRRVYDTVLAAQTAAIEAARAGITGVALDKIARDMIYSAGYEGCFGHGLGHSLGLEVHEDPRANTLWQEELQAGIVMTIEPGIYLKGRFGVRIENMVVLEEGGCQNLTDSARELIVL